MSVDAQAHRRPEIENLLAENRTFPPDPAFVAQANATAALYDEAANADYVGVLGAPGPGAALLVHALRPRPSSGTSRSRSGSRAASSTSPTTAWTATWSAAWATRSPTTGSASRATRGRSPTRT